jgi:competence protein ComEC
MSALGIDEHTEGPRARAPGVRLREALLAERDRWPLWLPVFFGAGIAGYFCATAEPAPWVGALAMAVLLVGLVAARRSGALAAVILALAVTAAGFAAAQWRTARIAAPVLETRLGPAPLEGRVRAVDRTANGHRLMLDHIRIEGLPPTELPEKIRLSVRGVSDPGLVPGQRVRLRAMLRPIASPSAPGGFDFQRYLYFAGVGAVGTGFAPVSVLPTPPGADPDEALDWAIRIARLRATITQRVLAVLPGDVGAVAAALIAGDESKISSAMQQAYRDSGLAHLLSISGLHIAIVAGFVMFLLRAGLAAIEPVALRFPIKKWAALVALLAAGAYAVLAGWTVPTQRSFLMMALVLLALMIDRSGIRAQTPQIKLS